MTVAFIIPSHLNIIQSGMIPITIYIYISEFVLVLVSTDRGYGRKVTSLYIYIYIKKEKTATLDFYILVALITLHLAKSVAVLGFPYRPGKNWGEYKYYRLTYNLLKLYTVFLYV